MTNRINHSHVPGGIYLCQVNEHISCGACCGLYNVTNLSRQSLKGNLLIRTDLFTQTHRSVEGILAYKKEIETTENQYRPYPAFHHCPYIGMIGESSSRVGCLLHPLAAGNEGIDYRGLSYYGGMACRDYFCPTCHELKAETKKILRHLFSDWYEYGLIITEATLLKEIFREIERRQKRPVIADNILQSAQLTCSLQRLCRLKLNWPFLNPQQPTIANYFFEDKLYPKPSLRYPSTVGSSANEILQQLCSYFEEHETLQQAETQLEELFLAFDRF
jgi:hypothetical protein